MDPNEGGKHLDDGGMVDGRVPHDAFQRVDGTYAHIDLVRAGLAQLLDRCGEPLGDLPLLGEALLLPVGLVRDVQADTDEEHRHEAANRDHPLPGVALRAFGSCRAGMHPPRGER
ncbi:MAG TPA: hypothetical protein VFX60_03645 [Micromonospora sp.]|nr:hypothetical protein [Micromonospora sp.]